MTLSVSVYGKTGPAVVLLHGFGTVGASWDHIATMLAGHRVIVPDLPGHGGSLAYRDAGPAKVAAQAVLEETGRRGIERVHLCGHSKGGAVAVLAALMAPEKIASLTLLAPGGFGEEINGRLLRRYAAAEDADDIRACLEGMYGFANPVPDDAVLLDTGMRAVAGQSDMLVAIAEKMTRGEKQGVLPLDRLAGAEFPIEVLWGTQDCMLPVHQANGLPSRFGLHIFQRCGHALPREATAEVIHHLVQNIRTGSA
jgi:pimeloyl-ACP methyl ester carboxylesterase